jgi:hypothetical protein
MLLVSLAVPVCAEPGVPKRPDTAVKDKAVHYGGDVPSKKRPLNRKALKAKEPKLEAVKPEPAVEPEPIELKSVRG